mgnify:CR=1 FL=1|tara:strand:+ start:186 stop:386 length:201 start_codon:yes stop_codon:yes gene_type:complete
MTRAELINRLAAEMPVIAKRIRDRQNSPAASILSLAGVSSSPMESVAAGLLDVIEAAGCKIQFSEQ